MPRLIALPALLYAAAPALAHELPGPHAHPHGDWNGAYALLLAASVILALLVLPRLSARRRKDHKHDPR